jgi:WhiB family redox-sensing transcriptional regulator
MNPRTLPAAVRALVVDPGGWRDAAACVHVDAEIFYPVDDRPDSPAVLMAKQVCAGCPVRKVCLADVMAWEDPAHRWGITAGLTPVERATRFARRHQITTGAGEVAA